MTFCSNLHIIELTGSRNVRSEVSPEYNNSVSFINFEVKSTISAIYLFHLAIYMQIAAFLDINN